MPKNLFDNRDCKVHLSRISAEPPAGMTRAKAEKRFGTLGDEMFELQDALWGAKVHSVLVVLQGRDSAGKDGTIKHVAGCLNPRGVSVVSFGVPTTEEREHDFLWRVHRHAPRRGEFAIFNRSHYEDVLVVRVHDLAPKKTWKERYGHIRDFEELLAEHGTIVLKYFLHITKDEQEKRLLEREKDTSTAWKLNPNDWKERDYWDEYTAAYEDAISKTAAPHAPWLIVPANAKWYRNLLVAESIVAALRDHRRNWEKTLDDMGRAGRAGLDAYRAELKARKNGGRRRG
ncbi:MAG: polyphosphate kinase 2 family protein [Betaproteobacteria bacterium]|jgi:PPK2 family polyphosphate:nucleotide phosphotransferase|nr:polyphosphate kinase 2 family protein [Betaproteobacteria bacterium]MDH4294338.1 polyphosphate kinase 2 family protein [Betaproteobacteria bacterium]MDH5343072.1 polyphosphate kinase 2 family protein [Betaproteobacteria bacterium]